MKNTFVVFLIGLLLGLSLLYYSSNRKNIPLDNEVLVEATAFAPLQSRERIKSTTGFSILPPQGNNWREKFGQKTITFVKQNDSRKVSFYAGAIEVSLLDTFPSKEALIAFVRTKKDEWGTDGRYSNILTSFLIEEQQDSCVRYKLSANDRNAPEKGGNAFLLMQAVGRFCIHPQDRSAALDLFYSIRYEPLFNPKDFIAEGEDFLKGLQFFKPLKESKVLNPSVEPTASSGSK